MHMKRLIDFAASKGLHVAKLGGERFDLSLRGNSGVIVLRDADAKRTIEFLKNYTGLTASQQAGAYYARAANRAGRPPLA